MVLGYLCPYDENRLVGKTEMDDFVRVARVCRRLAGVVEAWLLRSWEQEDEWGVTPPWSPLVVVGIASTTTAGYLRWHPRILSHHRLVIGGVVRC